MLESKDYIIKMFSDEIKRKNQLIEELLEKQETLETKLVKMEAVLMFDDKDFEAQTGVTAEQEDTEVPSSDKQSSVGLDNEAAGIAAEQF